MSYTLGKPTALRPLKVGVSSLGRHWGGKSQRKRALTQNNTRRLQH